MIQVENKELENNISYTIKRIKDISFTVNEQFYINEPSALIRINLAHTIGLSADNKFLNLTIIAAYYYSDSPQEEKLAELKVENIFEFTGLSTHIDNKGILVLPNKILVSLIGISVSHTRALFAKNLAGTAFQNVLLPAADPFEIMKHFFPNKSNEELTQDDFIALSS